MGEMRKNGKLSVKFFCFRFDVDSFRCINKGTPNLIALSKNLNVSFTFFINMGLAASRWISIKKLFSKKNHSANGFVYKLSNLKKLGFGDYFLTAVINPPVGSSCPDIIRDLNEAGHEIGLHGGRNHALWQHEGGGLVAWGKN